MNFNFKIHQEAVPKKVKDFLQCRQFEEAIFASINFYQEYDMIESMKLILWDVSRDSSLTADSRISIYNHLLEVIAPFYPTSMVGMMGKTKFLCLLTLESEKISKELALYSCRNAVSSFFSLFTRKKIGEEDRALIFTEIIICLERLKLYSKESDSISDPIISSLIEKLRKQYGLPKGLLLSKKPFGIE
jgi:hypothetical protein